MKRQNGFAHVQILLITGVVAITGLAGFLVYKAQQNTKKAQDSIANLSNEQTKSEEKTGSTGQVTTKEEDSWLLFTPEDKAYSIRVPDGWDGVSLNGNLYVRDLNKFVYTKGTKATVEMLAEGGWDGAGPFQLYNPGIYAEEIVREGTAQGEIKTDAGLTVHKYIYLQETEPEAIGYQKGSKVYNYYFDGDGKYIQVSHVVFPGASDQSELVERAIKTITVK